MCDETKVCILKGEVQWDKVEKEKQVGGVTDLNLQKKEKEGKAQAS